jgi:hypothetical protein
MTNSELEVASPKLRGRGHKKDKPIIRRIREEHGTLILSLPERLGMYLNQEITIKQVSSNPLRWEITPIKHNNKSERQQQ